ncbi:hypothetical protein BCR33DRAFT_711871 [Rhizoclosmatium globosum]|uniref:F-box domain-containing protein n=1 Tax=Rhizoclosmatium globosum TaxID=329046 RepID=A0A1Y2CZZ7_9FUNG|nr:hypothetical protein BCR33DRAFT_711871 [Rhizoclosmatium globosum]|eukprot:ORY52598.1 hypothetical protein BCR33DRAFT_711871 [Rhizoclosmatium globosum]
MHTSDECSVASPTSSAQNLPNELWDAIVPYVEAKTLIALCHALPQLRHISKAIYDVGSCLRLKVDRLWPVFWVPVIKRDEDGRTLAPVIIPTQHQNKIRILSSMLSRYNGAARVLIYSVPYIRTLTPLLPKTIELYLDPGINGKYSEYFGIDPIQNIVSTLSDSSIWIRYIEFPFEPTPAFSEMKALLRHQPIKVRSFVLGLLTEPDIASGFRLLANVNTMELDVGYWEEDDQYLAALALVNQCFWKRIVFEQFDSDYCEYIDRFRDANGLDMGKWNVYEKDAGPIYGLRCVVWERKRS